MSKSYFVAAQFEDVIEDKPFAATVAGRDLGLYRIGDRIYAIENICPHQYAFLTDGFVDEGCIECPLHLARFDIKTGMLLSGPAEKNLRTYAVKVEQGVVMVELDDQ
jgi:3-phenylpropionate/trans-cinnamate dioxygenase ferredoxin component